MVLLKKLFCFSLKKGPFRNYLFLGSLGKSKGCCWSLVGEGVILIELSHTQCMGPCFGYRTGSFMGFRKRMSGAKWHISKTHVCKEPLAENMQLPIYTFLGKL